MNKRAIAILGGIFILIVATLGFFIYQRSKSAEPEVVPEPTPVVEETPPVVEETPEPPPAQAVRLTDEPVLSPILFFQGNGITYFNNRGQLFKTDMQIENGSVLLSNKKEFSVALKSNISRILWPTAGKNYLAEFTNGTKKTWSFYDTDKASYTDLPTNVYSLDWLPAGDKMVYVWVDGSGKSTLKVANPDTSGFQNLTDMYYPDNNIHVSPDGNHIIFYRNQSTDITKNPINMVTTDGKTFNTVVKDGYNIGALWSPDSKKILFSKRDSGTSAFTLWVADVTTGEIRSLGVQGSTEKAVWSKDSLSVFVAVPTTGVVGQGLTQDKLYKITYGTGSQQQYETGVAVDARDMFLSIDQSILFFRNAQDNALYYISTN